MTEDLNHLSFEAALMELESIVKRLEEGKESLEDAIGAYERGMALKLYCEKKIKEATLRVERITISPEGTVSLTPEALE